MQKIKLQFADWDSCTNSFSAVAELCLHVATEEPKELAFTFFPNALICAYPETNY